MNHEKQFLQTILSRFDPPNYRMYPLLEKSVVRIFRILEFQDLCGN